MNTLLSGQYSSQFMKRIESMTSVLGPFSERPPDTVDLLRVQTLVLRSSYNLSKDELDRYPNLKRVIRAGTGVDNLCIDELQAHSIQVFTTPFAHDAVAELAVALALTYDRSIVKASCELSKGNWIKSAVHGRSVRGARSLVIGFGRVGRKLSRILAAMDAKIHICDRSLHKPEKQQNLAMLPNVVTSCDIMESLRHSYDYVFICSTGDQENIISRQFFEALQGEPLLINVSRGSLISEDDLIIALENGFIRGAALDVFRNEPNPALEVVNHAKVLPTPHLGGQTKETRELIEGGILKIFEEAIRS